MSATLDYWRDEESRTWLVEHVSAVDRVPRMMALDALLRMDEADLDRHWREMAAALFNRGRLGKESRRGIEMYVRVMGGSLEAAIRSLDAMGHDGRCAWLDGAVL